MATVTVRGTAETEIPPDRLRLTLALEAEAAQADEALSALNHRSGLLDRVLDGATETILQRRPSTVTVTPIWGARRQVTGQLARRGITVEVRADRLAGKLVTDAVGVPGCRVEHSEWLVDATNATYATLRADAVADARSRAEVYSRAAGLALGAVEWIAEPGVGEPSPPWDRRAVALSYSASADFAEADGGVDLRPGTLPIAAAVEIRYALLAAG